MISSTDAARTACPDPLELVDALDTGGATPALREHVSACPACRQLIAVARELHADIDRLQAAMDPPAAEIMYFLVRRRAHVHHIQRTQWVLSLSSLVGQIMSLIVILALAVMGWSRGWAAQFFESLASTSDISLIQAVGLAALVLALAYSLLRLQSPLHE